MKNSQLYKKSFYYQIKSQHFSITDVNIIIIKKNKNKKDITNIKCYNYKQKRYYANKCPIKSQKTNINFNRIHINDCK